MSNIYIIALVFCSTALMANGNVPIEECIKPGKTEQSSEKELANDCVTTCNMHLIRINMDRQSEGQSQASQSWSDWWFDIGKKAVQQYSPVQKAADLQGFNYDVFSRALATKATADAKKLWCQSMEQAIDTHNATTTFGISQRVKGCLSSLSLYQGCHDRCKVILNKSCSEN